MTGLVLSGRAFVTPAISCVQHSVQVGLDHPGHSLHRLQAAKQTVLLSPHLVHRVAELSRNAEAVAHQFPVAVRQTPDRSRDVCRPHGHCHHTDLRPFRLPQRLVVRSRSLLAPTVRRMTRSLGPSSGPADGATAEMLASLKQPIARAASNAVNRDPGVGPRHAYRPHAVLAVAHPRDLGGQNRPALARRQMTLEPTTSIGTPSRLGAFRKTEPVDDAGIEVDLYLPGFRTKVNTSYPPWGLDSQGPAVQLCVVHRRTLRNLHNQPGRANHLYAERR